MTVHSSYGALVVAARSDLVASVPEVMARTMQAVLRLEVFDLPLRVHKVPILLAWHPRYGVDAAHVVLRGPACLRQTGYGRPALAKADKRFASPRLTAFQSREHSARPMRHYCEITVTMIYTHVQCD
jgi:hypothetical protein